jgi:acyl-coenzyme A thioesterase PaaI-like protein
MVMRPEYVDYTPGRNSPSNCFMVMRPEYVDYTPGESISLAFPVLEMYSNPRKSMQGGFISAAFDNSFGVLVGIITGQREMASVDLSVSYHRPIFENDTLTIKVYLKSRGKNIAYLTGEAFDSEKRLVASASTNIMLLEKERYHRRAPETDTSSL